MKSSIWKFRKALAGKAVHLPAKSFSIIANDTQRAAKRLGGSPQQLVAHRKGAQKQRSGGQLANAPNRNVESAGNGGGRQAMKSRFPVVRNYAHPRISAREHLLDFIHGNVPPQLDAERLAMAPHR